MLRNPVFYGLTIGLPLVLFYSIASAERHKTFDGTSFPLYFMTAMAAYGAMWCTVGLGARISRDRATGWLRQVRITPLRTRTEFTAKAGLLLAGLAPFIVIGFILGYVLQGDSVAAADAGVVLLFALLGGVFGFQLATSGPLFDVLKGLPSYWLVRAGKTALGGGGWPAEAWIVVAVWTLALIPGAALAYRRSASKM